MSRLLLFLGAARAGLKALLVVMILLTACDALPTPPAASPVPPTPTATVCASTRLPPVIETVTPLEAAPGGEAVVSGSGGYERDSCGGYNESARSFPLYLDRTPAADFACYVAHCEGKIALPADTAPGEHCLSVQPEGCEARLVVGASTATPAPATPAPATPAPATPAS